ncbi:Pleckstrin homology domain [Phytophthora cactorum]|nr:Pleckstrin homology domain [Phytophthora cactorum]
MLSTLQLTRQCTCAAETESDSDNESDVGGPSLSEPVRTMSSPATLPASQTDANNEKEAANGANPSLSLLELAKVTHDPLKASQALHNAEALRQAPALDNVFCSCYDVDTVLATVQRRERGHFSPVQKLLLEPESIKQVFAFATSFSDHLSENGENTEPHPDKYRQAYESQTRAERGGKETKEAEKDTKEQVEEMKQPSVKLEGLAVSTEAPPTNLPTMMDFRSNASTRKMARIQRLHASMRFESSGSSISDFSMDGEEDEELMEDPLKCAVLAALTENTTILARLAELGMAELRFLDAHHMNGTCIPRTLMIDILRHAIEFSRYDPDQLEAFVAPIHLVLDTICASINYHQHLSTISEFAARDCFSDSDSDDDITGTGDFESLAGKESPNKPAKRDASPARTTLYSPRSGKTVVNHRPLASTLLVMHVVELLDVVILMSNDRVDSRLTRLDLATSLMDIFEKFPKASILHCRLVKLYLNLLNRPSTNGRVNNPLLRSVFRSPDSILEFILNKLDSNSSTHIYDAHLAIIGVKIAKICSSPTLQQELIRQFCNNVKGWNDFAASLVATHYQKMDALDDSLLGLQVVTGGTRNGTPRKRNTSEDDADTSFVLARPSSSASEYLSRELEPFRRLPMEKEGFGSSQNLAKGSEAVHPSDMFQSRSQSKFPESILDILQSDESTTFDVEENDFFVTGYAYQKRSKWAKVHLKFEKSTCQLTLEDAATTASGSPSNGTTKATSPSKASMLKQFLMAHTQTWTSRPKKLVVCNARKWIAFGRSLKKPDRGAFGFQVEVFDGHREEDETLTFVTRSDATRMKWFEAMQSAVSRTRLSRNSFSDIDEAANTMLVECVAKSRGGPYLVIPDINLLGPVTSASFFLKSEVPEEMPFWGTYHGDQGIIKYASLFKQCLDVISVEEKSIQAIGYSVIVEFDATFRRSENIADLDDSEPPAVKCACTDTYLISGNQIIGLTRTIADSEKLLQLLCDDE